MVAVRHLSLVQNEPISEYSERKVADTDDGFIMLAMTLYEELIGANLTRNQAKVAHAVCRKTYGFKKKMDRIADSQLAEICRISRPKANIAKNELISMNILLKEGSRIGPNKNISEWRIPDCNQIGNIVTKAVTESVTKPVTQGVTKTEHTKDIIKNIKDITPISPEGNDSADQKSKPEKPKSTRKKSSPVQFDHKRFIDTWNCKADQYGLPRMNVITKTAEDGINRLYRSHVKYCKQTGKEPADVDTMINGYIEFGYTPTQWACGKNSDGKRFGIDTALTQKKIDEILSSED
ncbi:replication protein [Rosenbergiella epipactidis]|uniref:replication protein n=1 Tax=Rosenbergiella epipactidis TaxID=1544694 RepID=UPI001F4EFA48|nr:replication protein [Rosenbergiella epipactidis]